MPDPFFFFFHLNDTYLAAGADAYSWARQMYDAAKMAAKANKSGSDVVVAELKKRFRRKSSNTSSGDPPETTVNNG